MNIAKIRRDKKKRIIFSRPIDPFKENKTNQYWTFYLDLQLAGEWPIQMEFLSWLFEIV